MLSVAQALEIVLAQATPLPAVTTPLSGEALGLVLAEDVVSDVDMPPFDKAMMDGYAIRTQDLHDGQAELAIAEEIAAGKMPTMAVESRQASRIMTGAPIPSGADAVVMLERCESVNLRVRVEDASCKPGQHILSKGREMRVGETVLKPGARLRPQEFGLLATVGRTHVKVQPAPRVAILATGDELVEPGEKPGPGQIRNGNASLLLAQVCRAGGVPYLLGIAKDNAHDLRARIEKGLQADVLLLSGGVSAGKFDLVPGVLAEFGVNALFHKVAMKPGKPILFGIQTSAAGDKGDAPKLIFALPGNPVASFVCFELFVRPALRRMMALPPRSNLIQATLTKDHAHRTDRPTYHPARLRRTDAVWTVELAPWFGSADLRGVQPANALAVLPVGEHQHRVGEKLEVLLVEEDDTI